MAEKPKTYPQQIQELKQQLADAETNVLKFQEQIALIPELNAEIQSLKDNKAGPSDGGQLAFATAQAKLNDLQQQADANASVAKQHALANQQLTLQNNQLQDKLESLKDVQLEVEKKDAVLDAAQQQIIGLNNSLSSVRRQFQDVVAEKDTVIENQSKELRSLRLGNLNNERILAEVRDALSNAPDLLGSLKYIVGIHGKSTI